MTNDILTKAKLYDGGTMDKIYNMLKNKIRQHKKVYITLDDFYNYIESEDINLKMALNYPDNCSKFGQAVNKLVKENVIEPVKSSKSNNQNLKLNYRIVKTSPSYDDIKRQIIKLTKPIQIEYYLSHPQEYQKDKEYIDIIDRFLKSSGKNEKMSINERAYQLFGDEKFLRDSDKSRAKGERIIKNLGLTYEDLNCYYAYEPFFCFTKDNYKNKSERNVLIVENKDTFWSFKKLLFELDNTLNIDMLIYGEGNKIINSFQFIDEYKLNGQNKFIYFGDLDAEGINIFFSLKARHPSYNILPFIEGYKQLIELSSGIGLPNIKKSQKMNRENIEKFCTYFEEYYVRKIREIILNNRYIPQEALSFAVLRKLYEVN